MSERIKNIWKRQLISFNPNFRIDTANPQMGQSGTDVYKIYGVTDSGDNQSSISLSSSGNLDILNDRTITISGGSLNEKEREDVVIIGNSGNVSVSAPNGKIRIYAKDIMVEADRDIHFKAGRNVNFKSSGGRVCIDSQKADIIGTSGNLISMLGKDFTSQVFEGSFVGLDFITDNVSDIVNNVTNNVVDKVVGGVAGGIVQETLNDIFSG